MNLRQLLVLLLAITFAVDAQSIHNGTLSGSTTKANPSSHIPSLSPQGHLCDSTLKLARTAYYCDRYSIQKFNTTPAEMLINLGDPLCTDLFFFLRCCLEAACIFCHRYDASEVILRAIIVNTMKNDIAYRDCALVDQLKQWVRAADCNREADSVANETRPYVVLMKHELNMHSTQDIWIVILFWLLAMLTFAHGYVIIRSLTRLIIRYYNN